MNPPLLRAHTDTHIRFPVTLVGSLKLMNAVTLAHSEWVEMSLLPFLSLSCCSLMLFVLVLHISPTTFQRPCAVQIRLMF